MGSQSKGCDSSVNVIEEYAFKPEHVGNIPDRSGPDKRRGQEHVCSAGGRQGCLSNGELLELRVAKVSRNFGSGKFGQDSVKQG